MISKKFAKIFESEKIGQILVQKDFNVDENYSVKISGYYPGGSLSFGLNFDFTEEGKKNMVKLFDSLDLEKVTALVKSEMVAFAEVFYEESGGVPASLAVEVLDRDH